MSLLDRWGAGVSHVIGLGGRDLTDAVDGRMAKLAVAALGDDPGTDAILLVSKPPSERVARAVVEGPWPATRRWWRRWSGSSGGRRLGVTVVTTLEEGVLRALEVLGLDGPTSPTGWRTPSAARLRRPRTGRTLVRGLFSGGTLCYESLVILSDCSGRCGRTRPSTTPRGPGPGRQPRVPRPRRGGVHQGPAPPDDRPRGPHRVHARRRAEADVAVVLLDVVLGHGSHPDPAGELAPVCAEIIADGSGPQVVAYVLGTDGDPQGWDRQRAAWWTPAASSPPPPPGRRWPPPPSPCAGRTRRHPSVTPRIALVTHSTKPRGGGSTRWGWPRRCSTWGPTSPSSPWATPPSASSGPVKAPYVILPAPTRGGTLEEKVFRSVDALAAGLVDWPADFDLFHAQDCIAARAAARVRERRRVASVPVVRTVHHVDDFTTAALIDCQRQAILEPDRVLVVSRHWQDLLRDGLRGRRRRRLQRGRRGPLRAAVPPGASRPSATGSAPATASCSWPSGGIEPRKGSVHLLAAMAELGHDGRPPVLPSSAGTRSRTTPPTATPPWPGCPPSASSWAATSCSSAPSPTTSCPPGTAPPTPSPSRR